jgi:hypothetical protein
MAPPVPDPLPIYGDRLDFQELSKQDPKFGKLLNSNNGRMDWQDARFVKCVPTSSPLYKRLTNVKAVDKLGLEERFWIDY